MPEPVEVIVNNDSGDVLLTVVDPPGAVQELRDELGDFQRDLVLNYNISKNL